MNKFKTNLVIALLIMAMTLTLAACGGNTTPDTAGSAVAPDSSAAPYVSQSGGDTLGNAEWSDIEYTEYTQQVPTPPFTVTFFSFNENVKMLNVFFADATYDSMKEYSTVLIASGFEERNVWEDDGQRIWVEYSNADGWVVSIDSDEGSVYTDNNGGSVTYCGYIVIHDETDR